MDVLRDIHEMCMVKEGGDGLNRDGHHLRGALAGLLLCGMVDGWTRARWACDMVTRQMTSKFTRGPRLGVCWQRNADAYHFILPAGVFFIADVAVALP